jgi:hypothetical protein
LAHSAMLLSDRNTIWTDLQDRLMEKIPMSVRKDQCETHVLITFGCRSDASGSFHHRKKAVFFSHDSIS